MKAAFLGIAIGAIICFACIGFAFSLKFILESILL